MKFDIAFVITSLNRVPTRPGKPAKMRVHLENMEISWNFENLINIMEKYINPEQIWWLLKITPNSDFVNPVYNSSLLIFFKKILDLLVVKLTKLLK